jgi:hypothetical protein
VGTFLELAALCVIVYVGWVKPGVGKVRIRSRVRLFGPLSAALSQISVIKHPLKATITDLKFSPLGFDIGNFEIQLLDLKE